MSGSPSKLIRMKEVIDEERGGDTKHASSGWDGMPVPRKEVTEKRLCLEDGEKECGRVAAEEIVKAEPRINTTSPPSELPPRHPGPLDLSTTKANIPVPPPSALATAHIIDDLGRVPYPEGIKSPKVELNINAKDGKFIYDREFLLQFMPVCKEKPDSLPALDTIGLKPSDQINYPTSCGGSGRHRQGSGVVPPQRQKSTSLGFNPGSSFGKGGSSSTFSMGGMGNFATSIGGSKLNCDDRFNMSNNMRAVSASGATPMPFDNRLSQMQRTASQGGPGGAPMGSNRTRSKRGEKRNDCNRVPTGPGSQHGYNMGHGSSAALAQSMLEPVASLQQSANRWDKRALGSNDPDSPDVIDRKVKGLLNKLMMEKFDSISDQIIAWANKSEKEKDGRTLIQVIHLVLESATDQATWSEMYARLCRKMMEQISPKVQDDGIKNAEGKPITGGQLFRKYLLNKCREDFERGWVAKEATAAAAASKTIEDQVAKAPAEKKGDGEEEVALYSEEYHAAQKAKRQGLGLIKFIGELFKLQMLTERIMHECVKKLLWNVENPEEEEIESLCTLLTTVGQLLDTAKARAHMDVYFSRMRVLTKNPYVSLRMQFMLQDIIEFRERKWISRDAVDPPTTIAQIHAAGKEKAAQEKESYQRQTSMSHSGSRRGGERGEFPQVGADGWAVAGAPWSPSKAGDLSKFGQISDMTVPATLRQVSGKSSVSIAKPGSSSNTPHKPRKQDIAKLFYNPPSAPPSQASSDTSLPNIRPSDLLPSSQPPSIPSSSHPPYPSFLPQNGMRPQQPNAGPNGDAATSSGPRSPQYQWQVPNGNAPHIPSGPGGHIPVADKKHKAAERELLKTEEEEREKECLQPEVEERKNAEEDTKRLQQKEEEEEPAEEEVVKAEVEATSHPSALATARIIDDLGRVPYPEGIRSPRVELNINAVDGKFIYDREFLLQFMPVCKEKPESLAAPDAISLKPSDHINYGQHRQGSGAVPSQHQSFTTGEPEFGQTSNKGTPITFGPQSNIYARKKDTEPKPINMRNKNLKIKKIIKKIIKKFSAVRNLDEAEVYFTQVPAKHHPLLVAKLMSFAVKSEADAQLVAELFSRASTKNLCAIADFESGFAAVIELLDGIVIDAPMAFKLMATMMKGPAFDDEQRTRLASKTGSAKLLGLLS